MNNPLSREQFTTERFKHVAIMFVIAVALFLFSTIPHKWWIFVTVAILCIAIEPGLIVQRTIQRSKGSLIILILMVPLLLMLQLNYRLVPLITIGAAIVMVTSFANPRRYDITIFFLTLLVFMLEAQNITQQVGESPFEAVVNRGVCTAIGIFIVLSCDYFLFDAYGYSKKLYYLQQKRVCDTLQESIHQIQMASVEHRNHSLVIETLRDTLIQVFFSIEISAENLLNDLKIETDLQLQVEAFRTTIWALRRIVFAYCFSELILKSAADSQRNLEAFHALFETARCNAGEPRRLF